MQEVTLKKPIEMPDGTKVSSIKFREPTVGEFEAVQKHDDEITKSRYLISMVAEPRFTPEEIADFPISTFMAIQERVWDFLD